MDGRLGKRSRFFRSAAGLAALFAVGATTAGCTAMRAYDPVMKGYVDCDGGHCASNDWHDYDTVMKGRNACEDGRCGACSSCQAKCAPAPCAKPCAAPCAPAPCAPAPCARPCAVAPCAAPAEGMPPEAKPGEAWCRVTTPAQYQTVSETVCSQCAGCRRLWVPPVTETRYREVCVTPACSCEVDVPGVTRTVRTCETVCPSRTETHKVDCATGCGCPPQECYATVEIPAQTRTVAHEVCIQAPSKRVKYSPPRYRTEAVVCEIQPGHWETVQTPAIYENVTRQVCVAPEQTSWKKNEACVVPQPAPTPCSPTPAAR